MRISWGLQKKYELKDYAGFDCGGVEIGLRTWGELEHPRKGEPCINFLLDDAHKSADALKRKGITILDGPTDTKWGGRTVLFADPDGNLLQLVEIEWDRYLKACAPS